jgi:hypothetical protein
MKTILTTAIALAGASILLNVMSCGPDPAGPVNGDRSFGLTVNAKDAGGHGVPGLRVSVFYRPGPGLAKLARSATDAKALASSTITFDALFPAHATLSLHELDGRLVQTLMDQQILNTGSYSYYLSIGGLTGTRVYICRLVVSDTATSTEVGRDSVSITLWQSDAAQSVMGYTGTDGSFTTRDTLAFPHLLSLPPQIQTNDSPTSIGTFTFPDSMEIVLTDTSTMKSVGVVRQIVAGPNAVTLSWGPPSMSVAPVPSTPSRMVVPTVSKGVRSPIAWKLYQNYPNPFN